MGEKREKGKRRELRWEGVSGIGERHTDRWEREGEKG